MDTIIKEYGSLYCAMIGGFLGLSILFLVLSTMKQDSKYLIAGLTGVKAEEIEYVSDVVE